MTLPDDNDPRLISKDDLEAMLVEIASARSMPQARDLATDVREFHGWTLNKLEVFEQYLKLYRRVAGNGTFIDAFAGTGHGVLIKDGKELRCDGSSLVAAKSGAFSRIHLIEKEIGSSGGWSAHINRCPHSPFASLCWLNTASCPLHAHEIPSADSPSFLSVTW